MPSFAPAPVVRVLSRVAVAEVTVVVGAAPPGLHPYAFYPGLEALGVYPQFSFTSAIILWFAVDETLEFMVVGVSFTTKISSASANVAPLESVGSPLNLTMIWALTTSVLPAFFTMPVMYDCVPVFWIASRLISTASGTSQVCTMSVANEPDSRILLHQLVKKKQRCWPNTSPRHYNIMKVPKGDQLLPDAGIGEPGMLHKKEANAKAGDWLPAYMARKDGRSGRATGRSPDRATATACDWPAGAEGGLGRLHDAGRPGPARKPAAEQPAELKEGPAAGPQAQGLGSGLWTGKPAAGHVPGRYRAGYAPRTMRDLPHGTGSGHARPGPRHPGAAPGEERRCSGGRSGGQPETACTGARGRCRSPSMRCCGRDSDRKDIRLSDSLTTRGPGRPPALRTRNC